MSKVLRRRRRSKSDYWHRAYICPFWAAAGKKTIKCEDGCMLCFRESCDTAEYISRYCASYDYRKCSVAAAKLRYFDRQA